MARFATGHGVQLLLLVQRGDRVPARIPAGPRATGRASRRHCRRGYGAKRRSNGTRWDVAAGIRYHAE